MTRRPSEKRPAGLWKNVSPLGGGAWPNAAERPPVSELESPKLKIAGKLQAFNPVVVLVATEIKRLKMMIDIQ